jgi:hypothetical protein
VGVDHPSERQDDRQLDEREGGAPQALDGSRGAQLIGIQRECDEDCRVRLTARERSARECNELPIPKERKRTVTAVSRSH